MINEKGTSEEIAKVEIIISKALRVGVIASAIIIIVGLAAFIKTGNSGYAGDYFPTTLSEIFKGLLNCKPYAIMLTGLYLLILTPVLRVAVSIIVFLKEKDYLYTKITLFVLVILIFSLCMGKSL
jgi:uncharacterized membrane protein